MVASSVDPGQMSHYESELFAQACLSQYLRDIVITLVLLNKLRYQAHFKFLANQIT